MNPGIETLLSRIQNKRERGKDSWICQCPAHEDRSPSLSITERNGQVLLHCFAGCEPLEVLEAVGLTFNDIYDKPLDHHRSALIKPRERGHEDLILDIAADNRRRGIRLSPEDLRREREAFMRVNCGKN